MDLTTILPYSIFVAVTAGFWTASSLLLRAAHALQRGWMHCEIRCCDSVVTRYCRPLA